MRHGLNHDVSWQSSDESRPPSLAWTRAASGCSRPSRAPRDPDIGGQVIDPCGGRRPGSRRLHAGHHLANEQAQATVTGIGIPAATRILYNAMLMKTSNSSYLTYRLGTLRAAANLYGCSSGIVGKLAMTEMGEE
jgi:Thermolysin metallopeptidase, alpha-helical domain